MAVVPNEFVLRYAPWSTSKADTAQNCPRKFKYQYVTKIRGLHAPNTGDALVGKAAHKLLEYTLQMCQPAENFTDAVISEFELAGDDLQRYLTFVPAVDRFTVLFRKYQERWGGYPPNLEQKIAVSLDGKSVPFFDDSKAFFRGVLDLSVIIKSRNHAVILDHKTGKYRGVNYYTKQFDGYKWLIKTLYPEIEGVQVGVNFLQADKLEFAAFEQTHDAGELRDRVISYLNKATAKVVDLEAVRPSPLCAWCDFHSICPVHTADGIHGKEINSGIGEGSNP